MILHQRKKDNINILPSWCGRDSLRCTYCGEPRELEPKVSTIREKTKGFSWKQRRSEATPGQWWNGPPARQGKDRREREGVVGTVQKQLREWWSGGVNLRRRVDQWAVHIFFVSTAKKLVPGRKRWPRGLTDEWEDDSGIVLPGVTGFCGFWDGSCRKNRVVLACG